MNTKNESAVAPFVAETASDTSENECSSDEISFRNADMRLKWVMSWVIVVILTI